MIIRIIASSRSIELEDARNFRAFAVHVEGSFEDQADYDALIDRVAVSHSREHAWISQAALRAWPPLADEAWWQEGLTQMITAVQRFGWIDEVNQSIRAHIEYIS
jgi:hypothetical protein